MKNQLTILLAGGLLLSNVVAMAPARAEDGVRFYCGQSYDPTSKKNIPTTLVSVPGRKDPLALIRWKSEYFPQFAPQERCNIVSPKFQKAYNAGNLNFLAAGKHRKNGLGIICGLATPEDSCNNDTNMLFTLKPYASSESVLRQLTGIVSGEINEPIVQSSSGELVDLRPLFKAKR
jgi:hypothetical protein